MKKNISLLMIFYTVSFSRFTPSRIEFDSIQNELIDNPKARENSTNFECYRGHVIGGHVVESAKEEQDLSFLGDALRHLLYDSSFSLIGRERERGT